MDTRFALITMFSATFPYKTHNVQKSLLIGPGRAVVGHVRIQTGTIGVRLLVAVVVGRFLQSHQHIQQGILVFGIGRCACLQSHIICGDLPQLGNRRRPYGPGVRFPDERARINPGASPSPVQLHSLSNGIHQIGGQMVVPDVGEPTLRVLQIHRAGQEQPGSDGDVAGVVRLQEAVDVLPHRWEPLQDLFQLRLGCLRVEFHVEQLSPKIPAQEALHRFHVVGRQNLWKRGNISRMSSFGEKYHEINR